MIIGTRLVEFIVATVVVFVFSIGHYISARIKKRRKEGKGTV